MSWYTGGSKLWARAAPNAVVRKWASCLHPKKAMQPDGSDTEQLLGLVAVVLSMAVDGCRWRSWRCQARVMAGSPVWFFLSCVFVIVVVVVV